MRLFLLLIIILLVLGWGFGTFALAAGGFIHLLLVVAIIALVYYLITGRSL